MTTPQMDWLDDQRRKRAVSSDDIIPLRHSYALSMVERITELEAEIERLRAVLAVAHKALRDLDPVDDRDVVLMSWWNQWRGYLALAEVETALKTEARRG